MLLLHTCLQPVSLRGQSAASLPRPIRNYASADFAVLSVTTPATVTGATSAVKFVLSMPPAKTISHVAGLREIIFPQCFHGIRDNPFVEVS